MTVINLLVITLAPDIWAPQVVQKQQKDDSELTEVLGDQVPNTSEGDSAMATAPTAMDTAPAMMAAVPAMEKIPGAVTETPGAVTAASPAMITPAAPSQTPVPQLADEDDDDDPLADLVASIWAGRAQDQTNTSASSKQAQSTLGHGIAWCKKDNINQANIGPAKDHK